VHAVELPPVVALLPKDALGPLQQELELSPHSHLSAHEISVV
jgi:hypothetical protein